MAKRGAFGVPRFDDSLFDDTRDSDGSVSGPSPDPRLAFTGTAIIQRTPALDAGIIERTIDETGILQRSLEAVGELAR